MDNVLFSDTYALETHTHEHTKFARTLLTPHQTNVLNPLNANDVFNAKSSIKIRRNSSLSFFPIEAAAVAVAVAQHTYDT